MTGTADTAGQESRVTDFSDDEVIIVAKDPATFAAIHETGVTGDGDVARPLLGRRICVGWQVPDGQVLTE